MKFVRVSVAMGCVAALLYVIGCAPSTDMTKYRKGELSQLRVPGKQNPPKPKMPEIDQGIQPAAAPAPALAFTGPNGETLKIGDFKGKVVLVNLWATWCAPCKIEMPTLAAVQKTYEGKPFEVIAVSADTGEEDIAKAREEIARQAPLKFYLSNGIDLAYAFTPAATDFPTTVIYNKAGEEVARLPGDTDWNGRDARALIDALLK